MFTLNRRKFLQLLAAASAFTIVPRHVRGGANYTAPSGKLNIAGVGMGKHYLEAVNSENIMALCDVYLDFAKPVFETYRQAKVYQDYREMLDKASDIDAVVIGTPDHTHAVIAMAVRSGKKLY